MYCLSSVPFVTSNVSHLFTLIQICETFSLIQDRYKTKVNWALDFKRRKNMNSQTLQSV